MQIIADRRALHRIPEVHKDLPETFQYLASSLKEMGCKNLFQVSGSMCVYFDFGQDDTVAFRSDADALPIQERNEVPYASSHPGKMHACGHDGHMAILLELARRLSQKKDLKHNILLIFQCAEETTGGALDICRSGLFSQFRVKAIFGLHLWPGLAKGKIFSREGVMMSSSSEIHVEIKGKSAHIARSHEGIDAMAAGVEFYNRAIALERSVDPGIFRLLKFGKFLSGTVSNAVSAHTKLEGSLRAYDMDLIVSLRQGLSKIARDVAAESGCQVDFWLEGGYPTVNNDPELLGAVRHVASLEHLPEPALPSEDFSHYQRTIPGVFFFLGLGDAPALHSDRFDFDESVLVKGADFFESLAEELVWP